MQKLQRWNTQEKALTDAEVDLEREKNARMIQLIKNNVLQLYVKSFIFFSNEFLLPDLQSIYVPCVPLLCPHYLVTRKNIKSDNKKYFTVASTMPDKRRELDLKSILPPPIADKDLDT